jgi:CRP-like cAMP-binding protein
MVQIIKPTKPMKQFFTEGELPSYYFQLVTGKIKINNYNDQGKEFIQEIVYENGSPVVTALFNERLYPANAFAFEECRLLRLPKLQFFDLLQERPELYENMLSSVSENMYYKYMMMQAMSFQNPENKLKTLMNYLKGFENKSPYSYKIPFTRQQLASLTGLSVETVIRVTKNMEKNEILKIKNRKIFF